MKNLKKVLALGLALVMILGMFTIASAAETKKVATDFSDWATIEHKDAVSLMVDLGIINGKPDGTFDPKGTIDRASWAKMVYFAATGSDDADAYLGTTTNLKDIAGNWAESYISYLAAMKYISGDNYGNYNPANNVTVAEANKMMLTVLGWDAEDRGYQNDAAWSGNIMTDAKREGLMENVDREQTALVPLTRENAAQIVYNALRTTMVEGENGRDNGDKYIVKYNRQRYTLGYDVFDLIETTNIIESLDDDGKAVFAETFVGGFNADGKVSASLADVGQKVTVFFQGSQEWSATGVLTQTVKSVVSSRVAGASNTPLKVLTGGIESGWTNTFDKANDDDYCGYELADTYTTYVNGEKQLGSNYTTEVKSGNVVELYDFKGDDGVIDTIKIYNYTVKKAGGDVETRTDSDGKLSIRISSVIPTWTEADKIEGYADVAKDDVVLMYNNGKNTVIEIANKFTGKVSKQAEDGKLTVNGKAYAKSGLPTAAGDIDFANFSVSSHKDDEYDFFLDKNGDVCYTVLITEGTDKSKVAIVLDAWINTNGNDNSTSVRSKLLFTDGTTELVDVAKVNSTKAADIEDVEIEVKIETAFYNYKVNSNGKYELTEMADGDDWHNITAITTTNGIDQTALFDGTNTANSKTLFIIAKADGDDTLFSTYTSFRNVPKMLADNVTGGFAIAEKADAPVKYVYIKSTGFVGDGSDGLVFIRDDKYLVDADDNYTINVVDANGEKVELVVSSDVADDLGYNSTVAVGKFFEIKSMDENKVVTSVSTPAEATDTLVDIGSEVIKASGSKTYTYDDATVFVVIDLKSDGKFDTCEAFAPDSLDTDAELYQSVKVIVTPVDDTVDFVYVVRTAVEQA